MHQYAPLAQLDRALVYGTKGQEFEPLTARQKIPCSNEQGIFLFCVALQTWLLQQYFPRKVQWRSQIKAIFLLQFGVLLLQIALFDMLQQYHLQPNAIVVQL